MKGGEGSRREGMEIGGGVRMRGCEGRGGS